MTAPAGHRSQGMDRRAFLTATVAAPLLGSSSPTNPGTDWDAVDRAVTARVNEQYDSLVQYLSDEPDLAAAVPLPPMDILLPVARWIYPQYLQARDGEFVAFWGRTRTRVEAEDLAIYMTASECERVWRHSAMYAIDAARAGRP